MVQVEYAQSASLQVTVYLYISAIPFGRRRHCVVNGNGSFLVCRFGSWKPNKIRLFGEILFVRIFKVDKFFGSNLMQVALTALLCCASLVYYGV